MTERLGAWVYGVTRPFRPERLALLTGVDREPVRSVEASGLAAVVGSVDLEDFGEEALRRNLEDIDWLEACARAHHRVLEAVVQFAPVIPMRLAVVFHDDSGVRAMLENHREGISAALRRVDGRFEWGVKAYAESQRIEPPPDPPESTSEQGRGTAYLLKRRAQLSAREQARADVAQAAEDVHAALAELATASRRHPPQDRRLTRQASAMVLNGAYLLDEERTDEFVAVATDLDDRHPELRLELTGPWPPYSFATLEDEGPSA
ncbi:MAG TPA: GvpL/GvpF family gas vesicle protein [Acidimicrobiales bacterium]|nr:GvpL/GvpF family gas vesicle protein [Acidimicrobiales bacterium]